MCNFLSFILFFYIICSLNISSHSNSTLKGLLSIRSLGHAMLLFLNGEFLGNEIYDLFHFSVFSNKK